MKKRFTDFLLKHSFWTVELYSALTKILWGILFLVGLIQTDREPFQAFGTVMPREFVWGAFFIYVGATHARALLRRKDREFHAQLSLYVWTWISIILVFQDKPTGAAVYGLLALFCGLASLRLRLLKNAGVIDD